MKFKIKKSPVLTRNYNNLETVISGGQIGVDQAGLMAARRVGLKTGGHTVKGYLTKDGCRPSQKIIYHLEDDCPDYRSRTRKNVQTSDGTIRLAYNFQSPGELCTLRAIRDYYKPSLDIILHAEELRPIEEVALWIVMNDIKILNIAGNADKVLLEPVIDYLVDVFNKVIWKEHV